MKRFNVRKVAVLGAGVMGAQIAAHLVNVKVPVILFDLPAKEGPKNGIVTKAVDGLKKLKPAPLGVPEDAALIEQANYEEHLAKLGECDLIIEAIAERMDWKLDLYTKIAPAVAPHAIVASNTSGLSITKLSEVLPEEIKSRFCGIHFFNPPRYMALVELIATPTTNPEILDQLEAFVTSALGKSVVRAKDTPNFIANRVGIAGMLATMKEAENFGLSYDVVDDLTGKKMGRASSGTFRTADVVGLDTMAHVIKTLQDNLGPDQGNDPFFASFATPPVLQKLLDAGALGQKTGAGFYKKVGKDILRYDAEKGDYVAGGGKADEVVARMLKKPPAERLKLLHDSKNPQAQFLWAILRDSFHYAAVHLGDVAESARDIDFAMRWGFGMKQGPFELWQEAGWTQVAKWIQEDIDAGKALSTEVDGEAVLIGIETGRYYGLDAVGTAIWNRIEQPCRFDALCAGLSEEFEGDLAADVGTEFGGGKLIQQRVEDQRRNRQSAGNAVRRSRRHGRHRTILRSPLGTGVRPGALSACRCARSRAGGRSRRGT